MKSALRLLEDDVFILIANIKCIGQRYEIRLYIQELRLREFIIYYSQFIEFE